MKLSGIPEVLDFSTVEQSTSTLQSLHTMLINANEEMKHYISLVVSYVGKQVCTSVHSTIDCTVYLDIVNSHTYMYVI